jgi:uncharacterized repeat protein (TIGR03803 family)
LGVIYEYDYYNNIFIKLYDFDGVNCGSAPMGSFIEIGENILCGLTNSGGINNKGVVFSYNYLETEFSKKIDLNGSELGANSQGSLIRANNGLYYGLTNSGGINDFGVLFELNLSNDEYVVVYNFASSADGYYPFSSLCQSENGNLVGLANQGGKNGQGCIFEIDGVTREYSKKVDFLSTNFGSNPRGSLVYSANGKYYGMTKDGGANGAGVIFEFDQSSGICEKKLDFTGVSGVVSGSNPEGSLISAANNKLYGLTYNGGANNMGVLFIYDPNTNTYSKKIDFSGSSNGSHPFGSLMLASNGKLYGMTDEGGDSNYGVLFEYDPVGDIFTKKINFLGSINGRGPRGTLVEGANGKLYGMTFQGGANNLGVLFEYNIIDNILTKLLDFEGISNGSHPVGTLMKAVNGKLYGMTYDGGLNSFGVLFEFDPATETFMKKLDFDGINGKYPYYTHLIEICSMPEINLQPFNASTCTNSDTSFVVDAIGNNLTYQWQVDEGSGFYNISNNSIYTGVTNDTILLTSVPESMNGIEFRCVITSDCPSVSINTNTVSLTVYTKYAFTENHSICQGETYTWQGSDYTETNTYIASYLTEYGCDSIYTLNLTVNPVYSFTENHSICEGETYNWQGTDYTEANTYIASYLTVNGCDSIYTLNLTVNPVYAFTENHSICQGETYNWQGTDYTETNTYIASYLTVNGCDSIYTLNLTVNPVYAFTENYSICQGETYNWQGTDYTEANTYIASYLTVNGCDSLYTLNLTVNPVYAFIESHSICEGETYNWQGTDYTEANTYIASYLTVNGCDSIYTLNLTVNPVYAFTEDYSICEGETYNWQGTDYTETNTYIASYLTVNGCDSIYTLNLTVNPVYAFTENYSICEGETYNWQGTDYTETNTYIASYLTVNGCDSIYTLNLTVNPVYAFTENHSICEGETYNWQGTDYTETNTYIASYLSVNGCDSVFTLNLTVNPVYAYTVNYSICQGETYTWQGTDYTEANTYIASYLSVNGCDSIYTLNLTVNPVYAFTENYSICEGETYNWQGTDYTEANTYIASYLTVNGCDSIYTLNLTVNPV